MTIYTPCQSCNTWFWLDWQAYVVLSPAGTRHCEACRPEPESADATKAQALLEKGGNP